MKKILIISLTLILLGCKKESNPIPPCNDIFLDLYSDQQANLSSEILRSQLADEISRALRLNDLVKKRTDTELDSNYPLRYR